MTTGSFCSGICAPEVAWHSLGWLPLFFSEIEPFPCAVEAQRFPGVPNLGDMTKVDGLAWRGLIDVLVAGTPCQAFSVAGNRGSLSDARGNLTLTFCELVHAIDPLCVVWENVPGVLSTEDNAFGCFLAGLVGAGQPLVSGREAGRWPSAGMVAGPQRSAAWRVLDAQYLNLAQRRERVFVVSFRTGDGINPGAVLFEPESVPRHSPPSREAGEGIATLCIKGAAIGRQPHNGPRFGDYLNDGSTYTLNCSEVHAVGCVTHTLRAEGHDASEDGTGRGVPLVVDTLTSNVDAHSGFRDHKGLVPIVAGFKRGQGSKARSDGYQVEQAPTLTSSDSGTQQSPGVLIGMQVRRLTPRECERLQGFPDEWTAIQYRGKPAADSPRYKALGNSMAVPVLRWIGERIQTVVNLKGQTQCQHT